MKKDTGNSRKEGAFMSHENNSNKEDSFGLDEKTHGTEQSKHSDIPTNDKPTVVPEQVQQPTFDLPETIDKKEKLTAIPLKNTISYDRQTKHNNRANSTKKVPNDKPTISSGDLLEYRMKRLLYHMGYFTKTGVLLKTSNDDSADPITDLDVFGIYIHRDFSKKTLWVDCKSGQARPHDRLTWIHGIQSTLNADDVIFVKNDVRFATKQYARKTGVQILDIRLIDKLESDFGVKYSDWRGSWDYNILKDKKTAFSRISIPNNESFKKITSFITSNYWNLDNFTKVKKSITALRDLSSYVSLPLEESQLSAIRWAIYELVCLLTLATLDISKEVYYFSEEERRETITEGLISSEIPIKKRNEILNASFKIAFSLVKQQVPDFNIPTKKQTINLTPPSYHEAFLDMISRITKNPHAYYDILRYFDFVLYEYDLKDKEINEKELGQYFNDIKSITISAKTLLHFIHQITGIPKQVFSLLI
ncbi:hypothetical protein KDN24_08720 [Bacillus sp. Bva_UNVM-123]|uniref:hypothetical protein n=1 Tax=Bacillus sp. Bva_UNVM-123 TaxID=2829798 RepID=UPI00391FC5E4